MSVTPCAETQHNRLLNYQYFTKTYEVEVNPYTGEKIIVNIDPAVYQNDPNEPYAQNLNAYIFSNSQSPYNTQAARHAVIYTNDSRYNDPNFRQQQAQRLMDGNQKNSISGVERYWILHFCKKELADINARVSESIREKAQKTFDKAISDLSPIARVFCKTMDTVSIPIDKAMDLVGKEDDPRATRNRILVHKCCTALSICTSFYITCCMLGRRR